MRALSEIGAAVIGSGFIGTVHIEALRRIGVRVIGLLGSTSQRGAERATKLGVARAYPSLTELLEDPAVEVVHVTSPNHLHFPQVREILAAGKHVVCEKPLAMTAGESRELVDMADASDKVAAVNFNLRFYPLNQHARDVVHDSAVGAVRIISGRYFQDWLLMETDWNWRLEPELGGALRAVGDIGSHWLDLTSFITGLRVEAVMADLSTFVKSRRQPTGPVETFSTERAADTVETPISTEDVANILIRYEGGARGIVAISQISAGRKNSLQYEIDGSTGSVAWDSESPDQMWFGHRDKANEILLKNPALMSDGGRRAASLPAGHVEGFADTFATLFRHVYADVGEGRMSDNPAYATFRDGHEEMLVGDAILESSRTGAWVAPRRNATEAGLNLEEARL